MELRLLTLQSHHTLFMKSRKGVRYVTFIPFSDSCQTTILRFQPSAKIAPQETAEAPVVSLFEGTHPLYLGSPVPRRDITICRP